VEPTREQQPAVAEPTARAVVVGGSGPVSPVQAQILMLQRQAGNAAVGRLLRSRRLLQRDDLDQAPVALDDKKQAGAGDRTC
jgi:predicted component of type VI protein secretion system